MSHEPILSLEQTLGARLKHERANTHLRELRSLVAEFVEAHPWGIGFEPDDGAGHRRWFGQVSAPIPESIATIIGDIAHNLRSALDLLAYQAVLASGRSPSDRTSFPISASKAQFEARLARGIPEKVAPEFERGIASVRPYRGGDRRFYQLHRLNIEDKHRLLVPAIFGAAPSALWDPTSGQVVPIRGEGNYVPLVDGKTIGTTPIDPSERVPIPFEVVYTTEIALTRPPEVSTTAMFPTLRGLWFAVAAAIAAFDDRYVVTRVPDHADTRSAPV